MSGYVWMLVSYHPFLVVGIFSKHHDPKTLREMSLNARRIMEEKYRWERVRKRLFKAYKRLFKSLKKKKS